MNGWTPKNVSPIGVLAGGQSFIPVAMVLRKSTVSQFRMDLKSLQSGSGVGSLFSATDNALGAFTTRGMSSPSRKGQGGSPEECLLPALSASLLLMRWKTSLSPTPTPLVFFLGS